MSKDHKVIGVQKASAVYAASKASEENRVYEDQQGLKVSEGCQALRVTVVRLVQLVLQARVGR